MKNNFPFKVDLEKVELKRISNDIENKFKIHANRVYNIILFGIQWNNERIDFLRKNEKLKDLYKHI